VLSTVNVDSRQGGKSVDEPEDIVLRCGKLPTDNLKTLWEGSADSDTSLNTLQIAALTLALSRRERELTEVFG
jgi:hypothetical protein